MRVGRDLLGVPVLRFQAPRRWRLRPPVPLPARRCEWGCLGALRFRADQLFPGESAQYLRARGPAPLAPDREHIGKALPRAEIDASAIARAPALPEPRLAHALPGNS